MTDWGTKLGEVVVLFWEKDVSIRVFRKLKRVAVPMLEPFPDLHVWCSIDVDVSGFT